MKALGTHSLNDELCILHYKTARQAHCRNVVILQAIRLSADGTREMYVVKMLTVGTPAHTILFITCAIIYLMKKMMLCKQSQGTENTRPIHVRHPAFRIIKRKRLMLV